MEKLKAQLRFPEFTDTYKKHSFSDIFLFSTGKNIKQSEASPEFEIPCVRYGELYHMYNEVITEVINKTNLDKSELVFSKGDEILLPSAGEDPLDIGSASALTITNVAIGRTINILKPLSKGVYSQIYVSYYINQRLRKKISTLAKGVSISNVYNSDLKTLEINLPTLPEQQKIASFLTTVDDKLIKLKKKKDRLEQYKKGVMQKLFSQEIRFRDENGNSFPDWEVKKLGELANRITNKNSKNCENVLTISAQFGLINQLEFFNKSVSAKDVRGYYLITRDDFAYNKSYSNGFPMGAIKRLRRYNEGVVSTLYICFRFNKSVNLGYMEQYFENGNQNTEIEKIAQEGVRNHGLLNVGLSDFFNIEIEVPSLYEQTKIADFLSAIDAKIALCGKEIDKMEIWKKGLLQKMFV